jgi:uncharacterized protein (TIGR03000 family)
LRVIRSYWHRLFFPYLSGEEFIMVRGMWVKLVLAGLAVFATIDAAQAGLIFGRRRNDCGGSGYMGRGMFSRGYGYGYSGDGGYVYSGEGYGTPMYAGGYYSGTPMYANTYPNPIVSSGSTSGYVDPNQFQNQMNAVQFSIAGTGTIANDKGRLHVQVPTNDARLWINNQQILTNGADRSLDVALPSSQMQRYTLTAQWTKDGREVVRKKDVELRPGQESTVSFSDADVSGTTGEQLHNNPNAAPGSNPTPTNPPTNPPIPPNGGTRPIR